MDFKFGSLEERSSKYFSSSPNYSTQNVNDISYFTRQTIRAGFSSSEPIRPDYNRNPNPNEMRELIQRELEKEKIRAEIIAEEVYRTNRRMILEEEVRRELMYEKELAMRRGKGEYGFGSSSMRLESRVPLLTNFEHRIGVSPHREVGFQESQTLPFQRDPAVAGNVDGNGFSSGVRLKEIKELKSSAAEINKDKIIFLAKPNATDLKRKEMTPPIEATVDTCDVSKKPKNKEEWSCALCRVTATSKRALDDHLQGKKHKSRESGLCSQRTGFGTTPLPKMGSASTDKPVKVPGATNSPSFRIKDEKEDGDSSLGKVDNSPAPSGTNNKITLLQEKEACIKKKKNKKAAAPQKSPASAESNKQFKFFCETCQVGTYSLKVMNAHERGKRHLAKVKNPNKADKAASGKMSALKSAVEENENDNGEVDVAGSMENAVVEVKKEVDVAGSMENAVLEVKKEVDASCSAKNGVPEVKKELDIAAVEEIKKEQGEQVGSYKERIDCDGEEAKELDISAVEEIKFEIEEELVESSNEINDCNGAGVEEDKSKVLEVFSSDLVVAEKDVK